MGCVPLKLLMGLAFHFQIVLLVLNTMNIDEHRHFLLLLGWLVGRLLLRKEQMNEREPGTDWTD